MTRLLIMAILLAWGIAVLLVHPAQASGGTVHVVRQGETLFSIAAAYGLTVQELAGANQLTPNSWIYVGQPLTIPPRQFQPIEPYGYQPPAVTNPPRFVQPAAPPASPDYQFASYDYNWSLPQREPYNSFPRQSYAPPLASPFAQQPQLSYLPPSGVTQPRYSGWGNPNLIGERWIDVNLATQRLVAYEGQRPVFRAVVSTGTWQHPTIAGTFSIYVKYEQADMQGGYGAEAYDLADVPYVMYFHEGYGLHGAYWHNNFGTPMSHGCVNLPVPAAEWLFEWASVGTRVVTHY
ncbi:MAG: L,D-transpeptidase family protein [Anaerolineaceae bacterium]|nr:L,D-transpeptidase family protein [Anaerolineaceae bacterium]MCB9099543.1 L,D-transpeptidase family protein [Anaerolineales bacterium]